MAKYIEKLARFREAIKLNGGLKNSLFTLYSTDELKWGKVVGEDKYGNKYFENNEYFLGRNRWVHYAPKHGLEYDASQIPAEWHRWLHCMTDDPPNKVAPSPTRKWMAGHEENPTGIDPKREYVPYSTTRPKIEAWKPPAASDSAK